MDRNRRERERLKGGETSVAADHTKVGILTEHLLHDDTRVGEDGEDKGNGVLAGLHERHMLRGFIHAKLHHGWDLSEEGRPTVVGRMVWPMRRKGTDNASRAKDEQHKVKPNDDENGASGLALTGSKRNTNPMFLSEPSSGG
jgi:hypothetical protein